MTFQIIMDLIVYDSKLATYLTNLNGIIYNMSHSGAWLWLKSEVRYSKDNLFKHFFKLWVHGSKMKKELLLEWGESGTRD